MTNFYSVNCLITVNGKMYREDTKEIFLDEEHAQDVMMFCGWDGLREIYSRVLDYTGAEVYDEDEIRILNNPIYGDESLAIREDEIPQAIFGFCLEFKRQAVNLFEILENKTKEAGMFLLDRGIVAKWII